jgi:hypothetical protein
MSTATALLLALTSGVLLGRITDREEWRAVALVLSGGTTTVMMSLWFMVLWRWHQIDARLRELAERDRTVEMARRLGCLSVTRARRLLPRHPHAGAQRHRGGTAHRRTRAGGLCQCVWRPHAGRLRCRRAGLRAQAGGTGAPGAGRGTAEPARAPRRRRPAGRAGPPGTALAPHAAAGLQAGVGREVRLIQVEDVVYFESDTVSRHFQGLFKGQ